LKHAEQLLGVSARMMEAVGDRGRYGGTFSIGVIETVVHTWLPGLLVRMRRAFPRVGVEIHSYMTSDLHEEFSKGAIDLALTTLPVADGSVANRQICEFAMRWVSDPAAVQDDRIAARDMLERRPILTFLRDSVVYRDVVSKLGPYAVVRINPVSSIAAMVSLVKGGYGIATLPHACIWRDVSQGDLAVLDVDPALEPLPIIASVRSPSDSPIAAAVVSLAADAAVAFADGNLASLVSLSDRHG
jgi:DNA-binding transcriptional LysR family regulator